MVQTKYCIDEPVPIYYNGLAPIQYTGCGSESVPRSVLTLCYTCDMQLDVL